MVDEIIERLEEFVAEASRPGVLGLPGKKVERRVSRDLASYFRRLKKRLDPKALASIVGKASSKDSGRLAAEHLARIAVRRSQPELLAVLRAGYLEAIHAARGHQHVAEAEQPLNRSDSKVLMDAVEWAEKKAGEAVAGIDQSTVDAIADAVASGIEDQLGVPGTAREIRDILDGWSTSRAFTIASTEINRAMSAATVDMLGAEGVEYKRVILSPGACDEICVPNADQGAIPMDDEFDSGDDFPPFHPNCRCAVTAARAPSVEEAGVDDEPRDERGRWTVGGSGLKVSKSDAKTFANLKAGTDLRGSETELVPISQLRPTQEFLDQGVVKGKLGQDHKAAAIKFKGKYYVVDGHHNIEAARQEGHKTIRVDVYNGRLAKL